MLWAVALYFLLTAIFPKLTPLQLAALACAVSAAVEFSRLIPCAPVDALRLTLAGKLLLGRIFSVKNIAAYWLAIALTAAADHKTGKKLAAPKVGHPPQTHFP